MIRLVIFDLDGVLCNSRDVHYEALNEALRTLDARYMIPYEEHISTFDGLPTSRKLHLLTEKKGLPTELHDTVWRIKQQKTKAAIDRVFTPDEDKIELFEDLHKQSYVVAVCSNSVRSNVRHILHRLGLLHLVDYYYGNEDVRHPKPHSEIYTKAMMDVGVTPRETLIIEDSHIGRTAAQASGAYLHAVRNPVEVTSNTILPVLDTLNKHTTIAPKWQGGKMNVLIPMAGAGSRFQAAGYTFPKPLIEVRGKPMIQVVVENLNIQARHIFIVQKEHYEKYNLKQLLNLIAPNCEIVQVEGMTEGAACTTLLAKKFINNDEPLVIANSDQWVDWNSNEFMYSMVGDRVDAGMATFTATHPKWSFARLDEHGFVAEVAEKKPISDIATVGIYYWAKGSDYVKYTEQMIAKNIRVNNEFYVCPVFNEAIEDGKKIKIFPVQRMQGLGTPEDLQTYLQEVK